MKWPAELTLRDYFAIHSPELIENDSSPKSFRPLSDRDCPDWENDLIGALTWWDEIEAKRRYMLADAMIRERAK